MYSESGKRRSWQHIDYEFNPDPTINKKVPGLGFYSQQMVNNGTRPRLESICYGFYEEEPKWLHVKKVTSRVYDQEDDTKFIESQVEYEYNTKNQQIARIISTDRESQKTITSYKYPVDYPDRYQTPDHPVSDYNVVINEMTKRHMIAVPIETQVWQQKAGESEKLLSATITTFQFVSKPSGFNFWQFNMNYPASNIYRKYTMILPSQVLQLNTNTALNSYQASTLDANGNFSYQTSSFTSELMVNGYDEQGNALEVQSRNNQPMSTVMGYSSTTHKNILPIAQIANANHNQVAYTSFEAADNEGNWLFSGFTTEAKTGEHSYSGTVQSQAGLSDLPYKVSFWVKGSGAVINGNNVPASSDWTYYEILLSNPGQIQITTGSAKIDELRLHPASAQMTTYTYRPLVGVTSTSDQNSRSTYQDYYEQGWLKAIRDQNQHLLRTYHYHYKQ